MSDIEVVDEDYEFHNINTNFSSVVTETVKTNQKEKSTTTLKPLRPKSAFKQSFEYDDQVTSADYSEKAKEEQEKIESELVKERKEEKKKDLNRKISTKSHTTSQTAARTD